MEHKDEQGVFYRALLNKDAQFDGSIFFAIKTTGIFCRSICTARKPKRENVRYFDTAREAINAGFRPCKICAPLDYPDDIPPAYRDLMALVTADPPVRLQDWQIRGRGVEPETLRRWFKKRYGMTFQAFSRTSRLSKAFDAIRCGTKVVDAGLAAGFESLSGFGAAAKKISGTGPTGAAEAGVLLVSRFETPLGTMVAGDWNGRLCLLEFADRRALEREVADLERLLKVPSRPGHTDLHAMAEKQISEYFKRERKLFDIPLETPGSDFQKSVWKILMAIPYGETRSYRDQAAALGRPQAVRAVANANGQNRMSIIIPCHRVIGADGSLTGYGGGLPRKKSLLELESGQNFL